MAISRVDACPLGGCLGRGDGAPFGLHTRMTEPGVARDAAAECG